MRSSLLLKIGSVTLAISIVSAASAQEAQTTRERQQVSSRAANQMVRKDLLSILEPIPKIRRGMLRQLNGLTMTTGVFGTEFDGVCEQDLLTLKYAPTERRTDLEDVPLLPYGVGANSLFHIIKLPRKEPTPNWDRTYVWQPGCRALHPNDDIAWIAATDARTAVQGALVLEAAVNAIKSGSLKADPCPDLRDAKSTCEAAILKIGDVSEIDSITPCGAEQGTLCYEVDLASATKLTIKATAPRDALLPTTVTSIKLEEYIIVT